MTPATITFSTMMPAASLATASPFEIHTLEWFFQHNQQCTTRLRSYEMIWIRSGTGELTIDDLDMQLLAGNVYLFRPGQFRHLQHAHRIDGYYLTMQPDFFHFSGSEAMLLPGDNHHAFDGAIVIETDEEVRQEAEDILIKLRREFTHYANTRGGIMKGLFRIFVLYLSQKMTRPAGQVLSGTEKDLVNRFMVSLKKHFTTRKMVADYAGEFCVTPGHLNRIVKKISGFPVSYHIQQQIVLEAKRLACYSDRSMKEIAYALGFDDLAHFSKFFKNNSGMNFSNFKKMVAGF